MKKLMTLTLLLAAAFALTTCGIINPLIKSGGIPYTGDGGKGTSIAILPPQSVGLSKDLDYLPALVQGEFVSNFSGYSAINVLDRVALESQYAELLSGYYPDDAEGVITLGHLPPTTYLMMGKITKTSSGYALQITVAKNADGATVAAYSGTCTVAELDNLTGIRRSSQELLEKMGVELNTQAKTELAGSAREQSVNAQTALAKGITAQRSGTEVKALAYYYQAVGFDPSLREAAGRASVISASISSGNIGEDARNKIAAYRNDMAHKKAWEQVLAECGAFLKNHSPFEIVISQKLYSGDINYAYETIALGNSDGITIKPSNGFDMIRDIQKGLNKTGRREEWRLLGWPFALNANAHYQNRNGSYYFDWLNQVYYGKKMMIELELINEQNKTIARTKQDCYGVAGYTVGEWNDKARVSPRTSKFRVNFKNVKVSDITDTLTIKVVSVNGIDAETAGRTGYIKISAGR